MGEKGLALRKAMLELLHDLNVQNRIKPMESSEIRTEIWTDSVLASLLGAGYNNNSKTLGYQAGLLIEDSLSQLLLLVLTDSPHMAVHTHLYPLAVQEVILGAMPLRIASVMF